MSRMCVEQITSACKDADPLALHDVDDFRRAAIYSKEVECVFLPHVELLHSVYNRMRACAGASIAGLKIGFLRKVGSGVSQCNHSMGASV